MDNVLYVSGAVARDVTPEGITRVYQSLERSLKSFGATFQNVVKENLYTTDIEAMKRYNDASKVFYKNDFPLLHGSEFAVVHGGCQTGSGINRTPYRNKKTIYYGAYTSVAPGIKNATVNAMIAAINANMKIFNLSGDTYIFLPVQFRRR